MKKIIYKNKISVLFITLLSLTFAHCFVADTSPEENKNQANQNQTNSSNPTSATPAGPFTLTSSASDGGFNNGGAIPVEFKDTFGGQCSGSNNFPKLTWSNVPANTKSFVLIVADSTNPWVHLNLYNISSTRTSINKIEATGAGKTVSFTGIGSTGTNSWSGSGAPHPTTSGWAGPCPPAGPAHTYHFKLYALSVSSIAALNSTTRATFETNQVANILASSEITGTSSN